MARISLHTIRQGQHLLLRATEKASIVSKVDTSPIQCTRFYSLPSLSEVDSTTTIITSGHQLSEQGRHSSLSINTMNTYAVSSELSRYLKKPMCSPSWTPKQTLSECTSISSASSISDSLNLHEHNPPLRAPCLPPIKFGHRDSQTYECLDKNLAENLRSHLPSRIATSTQWDLLYSLDQHGASLNTFYSCLKDQGPCLLILENSEEETFGAYISEPFQSGSLYYGSGECFLWKIEPNCQKVEVYPWTMANNYLIFSNQNCIALGGGNGQFGLWIHSDLMHGHTESCATFGNPSLGNDSNFECVALEVWGFRF